MLKLKKIIEDLENPVEVTLQQDKNDIKIFFDGIWIGSFWEDGTFNRVAILEDNAKTLEAKGIKIVEDSVYEWYRTEVVLK